MLYPKIEPKTIILFLLRWATGVTGTGKGHDWKEVQVMPCHPFTEALKQVTHKMF